jgi:hypothetical protein
MTDLDRVKETARQIMRQVMLRGALGPVGLAPGLEAQAERLEPFQEALARYGEAMDEVINQACWVGSQGVHRRLHNMPGVDSEMLDEAVEYGGDENGND